MASQSFIDRNLALFTDLYQLTMAHGYWDLGKASQQAIFHLFFRKPPFSGGYAIAAGIDTASEYLQDFRFTAEDCAYLQSLKGNDGKPLFKPEFLTYLQEIELACDVDAVPEGTAVFGHEPLLRIRGPLLQCQLFETALLNLINFQTLIATKASRVCRATRGEPVLEFGLRRAQGLDGGLSASRAAYIGGCAATSNVLAGKKFGIPVRGTHAHSWVMSFDDEPTAFAEYARCMPNNCVFLVDTYDTLQGVRNAIEVGRTLRDSGHEMVGIRLDSGDLAHLSIEARKLLDNAGFPQASIIASNDLDEQVIESLKNQDAKISVWGVGTKLATAYDQPALGGVYKLGAIEDRSGRWLPKLKRSEQAIKTSIPGALQIKRFQTSDHFVLDMLVDQLEAVGRADSTGLQPVDQEIHSRGFPIGSQSPKQIPADCESTELLQPVFRQGQRVLEPESLEAKRNRTFEQMKRLDRRCQRPLHPEPYPVLLSPPLHAVRERLIAEATDSVLG